jgi:hypothetical protein
MRSLAQQRTSGVAEIWQLEPVHSHSQVQQQHLKRVRQSPLALAASYLQVARQGLNTVGRLRLEQAATQLVALQLA